MSNRVKRKLKPEPYQYNFNPDKAIADIKNALTESVQYIFLNQNVLRPLAKVIKQNLGQGIKIVVLSHGLASVDYLHEIRAVRNLSKTDVSNTEVNYLGRQLVEETSHSPYIDHVFCLAPFEVEIEKWLGAKEATHIPRTIKETSLNWHPIKGRLGFVGRLDHPPNEEGFLMVFDELKKVKGNTVELRIVGSPREEGEKLSEAYEFVNYLGELTDEELREDASTWSAFLHPVFFYAMGCSTKLAVALGWEIPIVTTTMGIIGYIWSEGNIPIADHPEQFANLAIEFSDPIKSTPIKEEITKIKNSSPMLDDVAAIIKHTLQENA
jgi:glycosyltransferase involved in cell wall biosynthesis